MKELLNMFNKEYARIYELDGLYAYGSPEYVATYYSRGRYIPDMFDSKLHNDLVFKTLVRVFCDYRKDIITSDREALAFMNVIKEYAK